MKITHLKTVYRALLIAGLMTFVPAALSSCSNGSEATHSDHDGHDHEDGHNHDDGHDHGDHDHSTH